MTNVIVVKKTNVSIYTTVIFMNYISYLKLVDMT